MPQKSNPHETVRQKVLDIFTELAGERSRQLDGGVAAEATRDAIAAALGKDFGTKKARDIGFHMADWNGDSAFITALHLFPERFTAAEIKAGINLFLVHAPSHIRAACGLTGTYDWIDFLDSDEGPPAGPD
jgi:hypothetical protein